MHPDLGAEFSGLVIGAAMAVHRKFGPGLDEADYEKALSLELRHLGIPHECQAPLPLVYKGVKLDCGYRMDILFPGRLLLELKALDSLHPIHEAQLLTYLRLSETPLGLLMNFGGLMLRDSIRRRANTSRAKWPEATFEASESAMDDLSRHVVEAAVEVRSRLGAGLLRSAYQTCLAHELQLSGIHVEQRLPARLVHRDEIIESSRQIPMLVEGRLMIAVFCTEKMSELQLAKARSLLHASPAGSGMCINFHGTHLGGQIKRISRPA